MLTLGARINARKGEEPLAYARGSDCGVRIAATDFEDVFAPVNICVNESVFQEAVCGIVLRVMCGGRPVGRLL